MVLSDKDIFRLLLSVTWSSRSNGGYETVQIRVAGNSTRVQSFGKQIMKHHLQYMHRDSSAQSYKKGIQLIKAKEKESP